jgi:hypothetical protein
LVIPPGPEKLFPVELAHTALVPVIEQVGNGFTVKVAANEVAVPQTLEKNAR